MRVFPKRVTIILKMLPLSQEECMSVYTTPLFEQSDWSKATHASEAIHPVAAFDQYTPCIGITPS
jgi:hypothetical protein